MDNTLYHHGVKGMKWGVRRYQRKDGSLTKAGKQRRLENEKAQQETETKEQKRARLLKSSNAQELYENRHLLTTNEINERLTRIDTEKRLGAEAEKSRQTFTKKVNKLVEVGKTLNSVYELTNTPLGKAIKSAITGKKDDTDPKSFDLDEVWKNRDKLSTAELADAVKRLNQQKILKGYKDEADSKKAGKKTESKDSDKKKDDDDDSGSAKKSKVGDSTTESTTHYKGGKSSGSSSGSDSGKTKSSNNDSTSEPKVEFMGKAKTNSSHDSGSSASKEKATYDISDYIDYDDVSSSTVRTSAVTTTGRSYISDLVSTSGSTSTNSRSNNDTVAIGQTFIAGLLEAPKK